MSPPVNAPNALKSTEAIAAVFSATEIKKQIHAITHNNWTKNKVDHEYSGPHPKATPLQSLSQTFSYSIKPDFRGLLVTGLMGFHSMPDGPLMLQVNWPVADTIFPQSNKFVTSVNINWRQHMNQMSTTKRFQIYKFSTSWASFHRVLHVLAQMSFSLASVQRFISYSSVIWISSNVFPRNLSCSLDKWWMESTSPTGKSIGPKLSDTTFIAQYYVHI